LYQLGATKQNSMADAELIETFRTFLTELKMTKISAAKRLIMAITIKSSIRVKDFFIAFLSFQNSLNPPVAIFSKSEI